VRFLLLGEDILGKTNEQIAMSVSVNTILCNALLSALKLSAGILAKSDAMISDSVNSISDVFSTVIVIIGVKLANRKPDREHPYGHERFECVAAMILSAVLFATGAGIGWTGVRKIISGGSGGLEVPGVLALAAAVISMAVKEAMFRYTRAAARKVNSGALMAAAWDHRSDVLSSAGGFIGILGARLGLPVLDPIAGVVICLFILKVALDIFRDAVGKMTDKACDEETEQKIRQAILAQDTVIGIDRLRTRQFGNKMFVDVDILVDGASTLSEAHGTAEKVHDVIESMFHAVKHCMVHVNPV
jgi:cation diffusion facilitator family transporter